MTERSHTEVDCLKDQSRFAEEYSKIKIYGHFYLEVRDVPDLINTYVKGTKTLDYGCGAGKSTRFLKSLGLDVDGVDVNSNMVEIAKQKDPNGKYATIESGKIPAPDNEYDLVYCGFVICEVSSKKELVEICKEICRVLKPDGIFIMLTNPEHFYNKNWLGINTEFEENKNVISGSRVKLLFKDIDLCITNYFWTDQDLEEMMRLSGMTILEKHYPLGKDSDGYDWKLEKLMSPVLIHVAKKNNEK